MQSVLFGVGPLDLVAFAAAPLILIPIAIAACLLPASRAARTNPIEALTKRIAAVAADAAPSSRHTRCNRPSGMTPTRPPRDRCALSLSRLFTARSAAAQAPAAAAASAAAALGRPGRRIVRRHQRQFRYSVDRRRFRRAPPRIDLADRIDGDARPHQQRRRHHRRALSRHAPRAAEADLDRRRVDRHQARTRSVSPASTRGRFSTAA